MPRSTTTPFRPVLAVALLVACGSPPAAAPTEPARDVSEQQSEDIEPNPAPGAEPFPGVTAKRIREAWEARPDGYVPRTRHFAEDGGPLYTNRLFLETSPYLRQHAHNPVDWYPWGDEAFEVAAGLGRPVLLSVGYSTCHWCHVMEEESFEDLEIARYLNENYVAIKVDREERPDVDAVYMAAVHAIAGSGGWPMTVWLTPDRKPYYGGTYFPARDGDRGARMGFLTMLMRLKEAYVAQPDDVAASAEQLATHLQGALSPSMAGDLPDAGALARVASQYKARYDDERGGLSGAPKFPSSLPIRFLLREHQRTGDAKLLEMATHTLRQMAAGGMYDQVGGGFHRYSTDARWLVPHFEKMLYDNALLAVAYTEAWRLTRDDDLERTAREILRYVERDMTSPEGAFYSATDADSPVPGTDEREEGWFFTWTPDELREVLDAEHARAVVAWYAVTRGGNFEGRSILHTPRPAPEVARELGVSVDQLETLIAEARQAMYTARLDRPPPIRDDKILVAWNGLMISAYARAALAWSDEGYAASATRAAEIVLARMRVDGRLQRAYKDREARHEAMIEDYAFLVAGLIDLFEATGQRRWLDEAIALDEVVKRHYEDPVGGWFRTPDDGEELLAREKPDYDGAEPTGASVHVLNLYRLSELTGEDDYRVRADKALRAYGQRVSQGAMSEMLLAVDWRLDKPKEVVLVTPSSRVEAEPFLRVLGTHGPRNYVLVVTPEDGVSALAGTVPLVDGKVAREGAATAYVCEKGVCQFPTTDPQEFRAQLVGAEGGG